MKLSLLIASSLLPLLLCTAAQAQPRKCTAPDGKVTYSDVACPDRTASERTVETSGNTLDGSGLREKVQKDKAAAAQTEAREQARAEQAVTQRQLAQTPADDASKLAAIEEAANANCVRDVERQQIDESLKAELFAACRTAGASQRKGGMTDAALQECLRNVERTGAPPWDKARQSAVCHGADVKPEPLVVVPVNRLRPRNQPNMLGACNANQCQDTAGQRFTKNGAVLVREDGKFCQLTPDNRVQCPR